MDAIDADTLRALQAPLKAKYRETPDAAVITLKATGELDDQQDRLQGRDGPRARRSPGCIRPPAAPARSSARATCCWRRWSPAPA